MPLKNLPVGKSCEIKALNVQGQEKQRMLDLGLTEGASVKALHTSPWGDPKAYSVMGAVIALREKDAQNIVVEQINHQ